MVLLLSSKVGKLFNAVSLWLLTDWKGGCKFQTKTWGGWVVGVGGNGYCFLLNSFDNENSSGTMDAAYLPSSEILAILEDSSGICTSVWTHVS